MNKVNGKLNGHEPDGFEDLDPCYHEVAKKYGRDLFAFVMNAGMAGQAASVLGQRVAGWPQGAHALGVLADAFNKLSSDYALRQGWEEETLLEVDRAIQVAFHSRLDPEVGRVVLPH